MIATHETNPNTATIMNTFQRLPLLAASLLALVSAVRAQNAYLETIPVTVLWNFNITGVSGTTLGPAPLDPAAVAEIDPERLRPVDRITTENGVPIIYSKGTGNQAFLIKHLLRAMVDRDEPLITKKDAESDRWELTAVREPQTSVAGVTTTPYQLFLTRKDPTVIGRPGMVRPLSALETGITLTLGPSSAKTTEVISGGIVIKASGSVTTSFTLTFSSVFYDDPRYPLLPFNPEEETPVAGDDYWSKRNTWFAYASGYMTYAIRSTPGPIAAVLPTKIKATGVGTWSHLFEDLAPDAENSGENFAYGGAAPLSLKMGEVKYQNRNLFPGFATDTR